MKMDDAKKRKLSTSSPPLIKVEVKEENVLGNDYLMAKGRLQGVLRQLTEQSESDSDDSEPSAYKTKKFAEHIRRKLTATPVRSTYLMKLYDRSVDLAKFEEDTPLYPICRAWMSNNSKKPLPIIKRRFSSPEPEAAWNSNEISDVHRLPPPTNNFVSRIPSPTKDQRFKHKNAINLNYDNKPLVAKQILMNEHLVRWSCIKRKWISTAAKNEERYSMSRHVLQTIYSKAQESMMAE